MAALIESNVNHLKETLAHMWQLIIAQMEKARQTVITGDKNLIPEIKFNEKRVDAFELKLDMDCENTLMLKNPVAVDLRFVVSALKINYNLERIGDYAHGIAKIMDKLNTAIPESVLEQTHLLEMFYTAQTMLQEAYDAFETMDRNKVKSLFETDKKLDRYDKESNAIIAGIIDGKPSLSTESVLDILLIMKKLERTGDHVLNIAEELVFYFDADTIKHSKLDKKDSLPII